MQIDVYRSFGLDRTPVDGPELVQEFNGHTFFADIDAALNAPGDARYQPCAEAFPAADVPRGTVDVIEDWTARDHYTGTTRNIWVYASPGAATAGADANLLVLNDGAWYADPNGPTRLPAVVDTLVHRGELGPTVAVFVQAGTPAGASHQMDDLAAFRQRSVEYDTCDATYVSFLEREIVPLAEQHAGVAVTGDPRRRLVGGISSGGLCAFNAAWQRPDVFGLVLSHCGSFTSLRGGHNFPYLVRSTPRKPIRTFLQSGLADLNTVFGNWPLANREMAAAFEYAGYDHRFEFGDGGHTARHGGALLADSLRYLFAATRGRDQRD